MLLRAAGQEEVELDHLVPDVIIVQLQYSRLCERGCVCVSFSAEFECEKDQLANMVVELKRSDVIGSQRKGLSLYKNSFSGAQLIGWLQKEKGMGKSPLQYKHTQYSL